jgi:hypothetical protein
VNGRKPGTRAGLTRPGRGSSNGGGDPS